MKPTIPTKSLLAGAAVSGLIAGGFSAQAASTQSGVSSAKAGVADTFAEQEKPKDHSCKGQNECKGKGGCKSGDNGCAGKNTCKGKGGCAMKDGKPVHKP
ncbi:MAG: hypothetical protein ACOYMN_10425 [Roseimicrobium sp.]